MEEEYVRILLLSGEIEALTLEQRLLEEGIPYRIRSYHDLAYDGLFQLQKGWGHLEAPEEYRERIKRIHGEMEQTPLPEA